MIPLDEAVARIANESPAWHAEYQAYRGQLRHWIHKGALTNPAGHVVWDMGCGWGAFSLAFLAEGAKAVMGTDTVIDRTRMPAALFETDGLRIVEGDTAALAASAWSGADGPTLLFMHLVSEHVADLPALLRSVRSNCPAGTRLFVHHDNYYQPVGHHDHGFLSYRPATHSVESNASRCWESPERCEASAVHRETLRRERDWQWSAASEATRDPASCDTCNYRIRAEPWAHLAAAERFTRVFPRGVLHRRPQQDHALPAPAAPGRGRVRHRERREGPAHQFRARGARREIHGSRPAHLHRDRGGGVPLDAARPPPRL